MSEFDIFFSEYEDKHNCFPEKYECYEAGKQSQQSKVDELQKRVDAVNGLIEDLNKCYQQDHQNKFEYWRGFADSAGILGKRLEQALKGGFDASN